MKESRKSLLGLVLAAVLLLGLTGLTVKAKMSQNNHGGDYGELVQSFDSSIKALRTGGVPSESLSSIRGAYRTYTSQVDLSGDPELKTLDNEIENSLKSSIRAWQSYQTNLNYFEQLKNNGYISEENYLWRKEQLYNLARNSTSENRIKDLRSKVTRMLGELDMGLPVGFAYPSLIILGIFLSLSFLVTVLCKKTVNWEALDEANQTLDDWRKKLMEAKRKKGGKGETKIEKEEEKARSDHEKIWSENFKQGITYLFPFLLVLAWLSIAYGGLDVAWVPIDSLYSVEFVGTTFGCIMWSFLTYFGFSYIWRYILIPGE